MRPVYVYLDSSDFSVLSNSGCRNDELTSVLTQLRRWVDEGQIICCFSGTHLCEMAPVDRAYFEAAQSRAGLLADLCGRNALVSQNRLFADELRCALRLTEVLPVVHSPVGNWYPDGVEFISPVSQIELATGIHAAIEDLGLNRKARRMATKKAFKRGNPRTALQASILANARTGALDEILEKYPMRPQDARVLSRYVVGDATAEEAATAFEESLRDPRWMMQWLANHHDLLNQFTAWIRGPAASMQDNLNDMVTRSASVHQHDILFGTALAESLFSSSQWVVLQDKLLHGIAMRMSKELLSHDANELTIASIDNGCPGLSVGIRSLHAAWRTMTGQRPRLPKLSDFPDALHAMYAPYVDIFRADSFMAPHIAKLAARFDTRVVSKLTALPAEIQTMLSARERAA